MRSTSIVAIIVLAALGGAAVAAESRVVFREGFDGTGDKPAGCTDACSISEFPPSMKSLAFRPPENKPADVFKGPFMQPKGGAPCRDYEFTVKFAFPRDSKKAFTLTLVTGDAADKKSQASHAITISEKAMGIRPAAPGLLPPMGGTDQDLDIRLFPTGIWHTAAVRCRAKTIELFVENDGRLRKFAQAEGNGAPLIGFNLGGSTSVDFDDIEVRRLDPPVPVPGAGTGAGAAGDFRTERGVKIANAAAQYTLPVPADATSVAAEFRVGTCPGAMVIKLGYADGQEKAIEAKTFAAKYAKSVLRQVSELDKDGKLVTTPKMVKENVNLIDAGLSFREQSKDARTAWNLMYYTRPRLAERYEGVREMEIAANWESFPAGSQMFIKFELRPDEGGAQLWLQGRYAGRFDSASRITSLSFILPAGGAVRAEQVSNKPVGGRFLALDVTKIANPGAMADAKPSPGAGEQEVSGVPFIIADGSGNADTGVCRENLGSFFLECDGYLSRTPFDGMPESLLSGVPVAQYTRAWALCAVEDDPDKVTVVTARLTKFVPGSSTGRGPAIADTSITLPRAGQPVPEGVREVGRVTTRGKTLPLYLVEFPIDSGGIQEIIFQERPPYLDFEVLGKRNDKDNYYIDRSRKPSDDLSGVHVFGLTLERSPVQLHVMPAAFGNVYQPGEKPGMTATLRSTEPAARALAWTVHDAKGQVVERGGKELSFARAGEEAAIQTPFAAAALGWYSVDYRLTTSGGGAGTGSGQAGRELLKHTAYFALIDRDTRQAGYESPYFAWNFHGAHGTIKDISVTGPLLLKAGIRNTHVESEAVGQPWKLTMGQLPRISARSKDPQEIQKELDTAIKDLVAKYPHASMALIFHESGGGPFPLELVGGTTEVDEKLAAYDRAKAEHVKLMAAAYRKNAPQIRLVVGNSGAATPGLMASLFRAKVPRECIDFIGEESVGMTVPPELSVAKENWVLRETARVFGYGEVPICACYEWKCRRSRNLGLEVLAEWDVRDILIAHAWGQPLIPTAGLPDVSNSYYNTVWGDGAFTHNPQVYPKPTYPAVATATQALDCAKFQRMVPTGSLSVYALEFTRGKEFIYALWTARGELDATLDFGRDAAVKVTQMLGSAADAKASGGGKLTVRVAEGAVYITSPAALKAIASLGPRTFPREQPPAGANIIVASAMDKPEEWKLDTAADPRIDVPAKAPVENRSFRRPGKYELRAAKDDQKGDCLELELLQEGDCPALMQEYAWLKLAQPVALPAAASTIGLWVKGNSSWGKVFWEVQDADGERWLSAGTGGYGCDVYDWPERAGINFDGWHFLKFPITGRSPITIQCPGQNGGQWQHNGTGNHKLDYPLKVTGVAISMPRRTLNLLEMQPVKTIIRIKDLSAY